MKSVFHIGIDLPSHPKDGLQKGFLQAGFTEYNFFNWQAVRYNEGILGCQSRLLRAAQSLQPNLIWCHLQNQDIFDEETAMELSKCGFTVNYTYDIRDVERTEWMYELDPYFGLTLFACKEDADEGRRRGLKNVGHIHSSCDYDFYQPISLPAHIKGQYPEIVFIGNNYERTNLGFERSKEREEMVNFMKREFGDRFGTFGMNWGADSRIISPREEVEIYNSAKIVVCHNNFYRTEYCSDRQWRAMACGSAVVFHSYPGFDQDETYDFHAWSHPVHLSNACQSLLSNEEYRAAVGEACRKNFLSMHTWKHRIEQVKNMIHELQNHEGLRGK